MSVETGKVLKSFSLADDRSSPIMIAWENDNKNLNYITAMGSKNSLWRQSVDNDRPYLIADLGTEEIEAFELAPDGGNLAFIRGRWIHNAVLIEGLK